MITILRRRVASNIWVAALKIKVQQKRVQFITLLFEVGFYHYLTEMITILG